MDFGGDHAMVLDDYALTTTTSFSRLNSIITIVPGLGNESILADTVSSQIWKSGS